MRMAKAVRKGMLRFAWQATIAGFRSDVAGLTDVGWRRAQTKQLGAFVIRKTRGPHARHPGR